MRFAFNEEQEQLRRSARAFLADHSPPAAVREAMASEAGYDRELWRRIGQEFGWTSIVVPEEYGGSGLGYVELAALMEEMGRVLLCSPFFSSVCLGTNALLVGGSDEQKRRYLPGLAAGTTTATVAFDDVKSQPVTARRDANDVVLEGRKTHVIDGHTADLLIVAVTDGDAGGSLVVVPADSPGIERRLLATMDQTRKQAEVALHGVRVPASAVLGKAGGDAAVQEVRDRAAIALSAEQVGGAERCLELAVEYAKQRVQFGRPIGSFQAIKHKCADMLLRVESARSASYYAAWAAGVGDPELPALASLAKAYCSETYFRCAAETLQIHGGVGFTWEYDVHLYFKRARASEALLGTSAEHRERIARRLLDHGA